MIMLFWLFVTSSMLFLVLAATSGSPPPVSAGPNRWLILGLRLRRLSGSQTACLLTGLIALATLLALLVAAEVGMGA
ncbi:MULTISPECIES: hypothetical protein [Azospirillum]|uniref:hypothetical protein n=1 Tax=Azospirillum TaxID=191 RepID=UPI000D6200C0|nr:MULTISPECIES: hypothetical protein [Azospirillum]PWC86763.1 hypothetical protein TSO5_24405 [Azospirillum sp. TSO5]GLR83039.1 hypothetical protein GCM10007856_57470 [Azospirillum oryzae]